MISADSSAWIEMLRGSTSPQSRALQRLIREDADLHISPMVLTEVLRGYADEDEADRVERLLLRLPPLELAVPEDYLLAAAIYRRARRDGHTIRSTIDCLIAASCIRTDTPLLHNDSDFDHLATCTPLRAQRA